MSALSTSAMPFQFHKGTIRTISTSMPYISYVDYFNSIKVQLERARNVSVNVTPPDFNSIKVQLEPCISYVRDVLNTHFNSIKVQLEQTPYLLPHRKFQYFNSIKVQLELICLIVICLLHRYFNSIKVQLEQKQEFMIKDNLSLFQFHKGTIRTILLVIQNS